MEKGEIINLIKGRIEDEQRKHPLLNWSRIAAIKIYTEWFEYFDNENQELKEEIADKRYTLDDMKKACACGIDIVCKEGPNDFQLFEDLINSLNKQD